MKIEKIPHRRCAWAVVLLLLPKIKGKSEHWINLYLSNLEKRLRKMSDPEPKYCPLCRDRAMKEKR